MNHRPAYAIAHSNIALSKYWGKRTGPGNFPAVPSLSVTLAGMTTRTSVRFDESLRADVLVLNGREETGRPRDRARELLDRVRAGAGLSLFARIESANDFPTASGLASSASGFAAMALAASYAAELDWPIERISDIARRSSASAARSLFGGFVELPAGPLTPTENDVGSALRVAPPTHLPLRVLVCVVSEEQKSVASTDGMIRTAKESPYYDAWLTSAPVIHTSLKEALLGGDFTRLGQLAESSALAMHASALAAGVLYFRGVTLDVLEAVRALRQTGIETYATIDAGPHVKVLVLESEAEKACQKLRAIPGVLRVLETKPGGDARVGPDEASLR